MKSKLLLSLLAAVLLAGNAQAQYSGDNQTNTISGVASNWVVNGPYIVGDTWVYDALVIQNGGVLSNTFGSIGNQTGASNNTVLVSGGGSVWSNTSDLFVGNFGANNNSLTIASSGTVYNANGNIGYDFYSSNNTVLVTGSGSVWRNVTNLYVGNYGAGNLLTISSNGTVYTATGYIGGDLGNDNTVVVTGSGSVWRTASGMIVGKGGYGNSLTISSNGTVYTAAGYIGSQSAANYNSVLVSDPGSVWSNTAVTIGFDGAGNSLTISNGGAVYDDAGSLGEDSPTSSNNVVLVSGSGSVWRNRLALYVGGNGGGNSLVISNGGAVYGGSDFVQVGSYPDSASNAVIVTGSGSVWSSDGILYLGAGSPGNQLTITNGGSVIAGAISIGTDPGGDGTLTMAGGTITSGSWVSLGTFGGTGTVCMTGGQLNVPANILAIGDRSVGQMTMSGGIVQAYQLHIAGNAGPNTTGTLTFSGGTITSGDLMVGMSANSTGSVVMTGGSLVVTNAAGTATLVVGQAGGAGSLILNGGSLTVNALVLNNGANSVLTLNAGTLDSGDTLVSTPQAFTVGDGTDTAVFHLSGGEHVFLNSPLEISSNAFLTGCGDINGNVLVDAGGTVLADCGGTLIFIGSVTNNGSIVATNGTVINFYGTVVNNGQIGPTNNVHYYPALSSTGDTNSWINPASDKWEQGFNWSAGPPSIIQPALYVTNASSKTVTVDLITAIAFPDTLTISNLTVSAPLNSTNTLLVNDDGMPTPLNVLNDLMVGVNGSVVIANLPLHVDGANIVNPAAVALHVPAVWMSGGELVVTNANTDVGRLGAGNITLSNGTALLGNVYVGQLAGSSGLITVAGGAMTVSSLLSVGWNPNATGTVWVTSGQLVVTNIGIAVGDNGGVGQLTVSNGSMKASVMNVGVWPGADGTLTVAGGTVSALSGLYIGGNQGNGTGAVWVTGGELVATNVETDVGYLGVGTMTVSNGTALLGNLCVGLRSGSSGSMTLAGGTVSVNRLVLTNGANSVFAFNAGTLASSGTSVTNSQLFVVGDGTDAATFHLNGGVHSFANNLEISSNAFLTGCGTINGNVTIDPGGTMLASCGSPLTLAGIVTNNGTMRAINGSTLEAWGTVVNNGTIDLINGATNFHGAFINNGTVLDASSVKISLISKSGQNIVILIPSAVGHTYQLQFTPSLTPTNWSNIGSSQSGSGGVLTFTDPGGATNSQRFYRGDVTAP